MSEQNRSYGFWILFCINICLAACFGLFWSGISIVFSFFFIWLNAYLFAGEMKKMLVLDAVFLAFMQAGAWISYVKWLGQEEAIDNISAGLLQLIYVLTLYFNVCLILFFTANNLIRQKRKKAASVAAGIAMFLVVFFFWAFCMVS